MKLITLISFFLFFLSCKKEQYNQQVVRPDGCDSIAFTFDKQINTIFISNCNSKECHAPGGTGSYDFTNYNVVANRIVAGTIQYRLSLPDDDPQHMPEKMHLSSCDYFIIMTWIKQGYPKN